jgi:arylsulfatase
VLELARLTNKVANIDGISFAPTLFGKSQPARAFLYREFPAYGGQQAIRSGDWKAVRQRLSAKAATVKTELYHLKEDPAESSDVAAQNPDLLAHLETLMREQHVKSEMFPLPGIDAR